MSMSVVGILSAHMPTFASFVVLRAVCAMLFIGESESTKKSNYIYDYQPCVFQGFWNVHSHGCWKAVAENGQQ